MEKIKIALIGVGNCASSLVQGISYFNTNGKDGIGLMNRNIGGYSPSDIQVVAAFDIDQRKIGTDVAEAIFSKPNCTTIFFKDVPSTGVNVRMGKILDGFSDHMKNYPSQNTFLPANEKEPSKEDVISVFKESGTEIVLNYLPVGSEKATQFYVECALEAGLAFMNNIPVFIASNPEWAKRFKAKNIPIIGDDIKCQSN